MLGHNLHILHASLIIVSHIIEKRLQTSFLYEKTLTIELTIDHLQLIKLPSGLVAQWYRVFASESQRSWVQIQSRLLLQLLHAVARELQ